MTLQGDPLAPPQRGIMSNETETAACPVVHFDHHSPEHAVDPWAVYRELRERCPVIESDAYGGFKVVTSYKNVTAVAQDWATFSSGHDADGTGNGYGGVTIPSAPLRSIPVETDPPEHTRFRRLLTPLFTQSEVDRRRARIEEIAHHFVDSVIAQGSCDLVNDIAVPTPAAFTLDLLGIPIDRWERYAVPMHQIVYAPQDTPEYAEAVEGTAWILEDVARELDARRAGPQEADDLLSHLLRVEMDGHRLDEQTILEIAWLVIVGGLDNTASLLANALLWLYRHPTERDRLRGDMQLTETAFDEFLRYFTVTQALSRTATRDTAIEGYPIAAGERVFIVWAAANRDPAAFDRAEEVVLERSPNRHLGFGWGPHRCIGALMAKEMFRATLQAVLTRMPDYAIDESQVRRYPSVGIACGYIAMPAAFTPSKPRNTSGPEGSRA
jgi:cytochrome P450